MSKIKSVREKYLDKGFQEYNIDYAIDSVKTGSKRGHIIESLTSDYRGMTAEDSHQLLNDLFAANGGEFKKENRGGYLYGTFFLLIGLSLSIYIIYVFMYGGILVRPILMF